MLDLSRILLNLLSNAIKFTPAGGHVSVAWNTSPTVVEVHVRDTGVGVPADKLEAIFEPFVQADASLTRPAQGAGLGLAISRELARGMGGDITVLSAPGAGSTFTVRLPKG
jgi:signal transduction histidine kinase